MEQLVLASGKTCQFCGSNKNDRLKFGPLYQLDDVVAHYYCVLLSNRMRQNGKDNEGMLGFLLNDIKAELKKSASTKCHYCKKNKASIKCSSSKCMRSFHLPCGIKAGSLHQFMDKFKSFCDYHRPFQNIPESVLREAMLAKPICCICYDRVNVSNKKNTLWAPCCSKTWYHRTCCQKLAHSAGYFFKCAICNDSKKFRECMQQFGIFIPQQDASWELVPNAFEELLFRYSNCDAKVCKCPRGRQENVEDTMWEIILCQSCGSQGIHIGCGMLKFIDPEWECTSCKEITKNNNSAGNVRREEDERTNGGSSRVLKDVSQSECYKKKRRRVSEDLVNSVLDKRKKRRNNVEEKNEEEDEDAEVDVETIEEEKESKDEIRQDGNERSEEADDIVVVDTVEVKKSNQRNIEEVLSLLKPGPLSYKLAIIQKELMNIRATSLTSGEKKCEKVQVSSEVELIELSDSDDENEEKEIEIIEERQKQKEENHLRFIVHYRVNKESMYETSEESYSEEEDEEEKEVHQVNENTPKVIPLPSLADFEIVGSVNVVPPSKTTEKLTLQVQPLNSDPNDVWKALKKMSGCTLSRNTGQNDLRNSTSVMGEKTLTVNHGIMKPRGEIPTSNCKPKKTEPKEKEKKEEEEEIIILDDDVEIILD